MNRKPHPKVIYYEEHENLFLIEKSERPLFLEWARIFFAEDAMMIKPEAVKIPVIYPPDGNWPDTAPGAEQLPCWRVMHYSQYHGFNRQYPQAVLQASIIRHAYTAPTEARLRNLQNDLRRAGSYSQSAIDALEVRKESNVTAQEVKSGYLITCPECENLIPCEEKNPIWPKGMLRAQPSWGVLCEQCVIWFVVTVPHPAPFLQP